MSPIQLEDEQYFFFEAMRDLYKFTHTTLHVLKRFFFAIAIRFLMKVSLCLKDSKSAFPNLSKIVVQKDIKLF